MTTLPKLTWEPLSLNNKGRIDQINTITNSNASANNFTNLFILDAGDTKVAEYKNDLIIAQNEIASCETYYLLLTPTPTKTHLKEIFDLGVFKISMFPEPFFTAKADPDNSDYIYSVKKTIALADKDYANFRRKVNNFSTHYQSKTVKIEPKDFNELWRFAKNTIKIAKTQRPEQAESLELELFALEKTLTFFDQLNAEIIGLYVNKKLTGFAVTEIIPRKTVLIHLFRTDNSFTGIGEYLFYQIAKTYEASADLLNFEQDLNITGLRRFKQSLKPISQLPNYTISLEA